MFQNNDYHLVFDSYDFTVRRDYSMPFKCYPKEVEMKACDFMCDMINEALYPTYKCNVVQPLYKLNTKGTFYGYDGIVQDESFFKNVNIYLSMQDFEIIENIETKKSCDIKMIVQDGEDISFYIFHQTFISGVLIWGIEKMDEKVWVLSKAVSNNLNK